MSSVMIRVPCIAFALSTLRSRSGRKPTLAVAAYGTSCAAMISVRFFFREVLPAGVEPVLAMRRRRRLLSPGVHVAFVVEAEVDEVLVALGCRRQALEADVVGAAVAGEHDHVRVV